MRHKKISTISTVYASDFSVGDLILLHPGGVYIVQEIKGHNLFCIPSNRWQRIYFFLKYKLINLKWTISLYWLEGTLEVLNRIRKWINKCL